MAGSTCRVVIHVNDCGTADCVDLALPSALRVGVLMPAVMDLVCGHDTAAHGWRLSRLGGATLDESVTLGENGIRDGDLLVLSSTAIAAPRLSSRDPASVTAAAVGAADISVPVIAVGAAVWVTCMAAATLGWTGIRAGSPVSLFGAALPATAAGIAAVAGNRRRLEPLRCQALNLVAVILAAVAGFLAVPGGPAAANTLLGAATAAAAAVLLLRLTADCAVCLTALGFAAPVAVAAAAAVLWPLPVSTLGAILTVSALILLGGSAKISIAVCGLAPSFTEHVDDVARPAVRAHQMMTGLVAGSSGAAAAGAISVAAGLHDTGRWPAAAVFAGVLGVVLGLRARCHVDALRRATFIASGIACWSTAFILAVVVLPNTAPWLSAAGAIAGIGIAAVVGGAAANPMWHRAVDLTEYLSLAAVAPLACWVSEVYTLVRGVSLI